MSSDAAVRAAPARRIALSDVRANVALIGAVVFMSVLQLAVLPVLLRALGWPALCALVPIVLATPAHWGLIHEAIHGQLLPGRRANESSARGLSIALALPFEVVRFGHLMHHRFTREPYDQPDVCDATRPRWRSWLMHYARLFGGLYIGELVVPLLAFLPVGVTRALVLRGVGSAGPVGAQVQRLFCNQAADPAKRARVRRDWLASVALHALALYGYGQWWPVLVTSMFLRGVWLSMADNLPHHGVGLDEPGRARNFRAPRGLAVLVMNHHLHRQHHLHPTLPWRALSALAHDDALARPSYLRAALVQLMGPRPMTGPR